MSSFERPGPSTKRSRRILPLVLSAILGLWSVPGNGQELPVEQVFQNEGVNFDAPDRDDAPPEPADQEPRVTQASADEARRISNLEMQVQNLRQGLLSGELVPGRPRSTDIAPPTPSKTAPTFPSVKLSGFFQADAGWIHQDADSVAQFGDIEDSRGFRRARLAAVGDVAENVSYMLEMDFAQAGRPSFQDVWLDIHDVEVLGNIRVGQWRQPFGMDALTSVRELMFLERAASFAFVPFRQIGVGFHDTNEDQTVTWAASGFGFPTDAFGDNIGDSGYGLSGRLTALPYYENNGEQLIHIGADYCFEAPTDDELRYRNTPEFGGVFGGAAGNLGSIPAFIDTGVLDARTSNIFNIELATVTGSFYTMTELTYAVVDLNGAGNVTFPGFYTQAAYLLTGEVRPYNKQAGVLGRIKPLCPWGPDGFGAFEIAGRYSYIDLNPDGVDGGRLSNFTAGLNWYLNQFTKFQFNYIWSDLDRAPVGNSHADILALRAQVDF